MRLPLRAVEGRTWDHRVKGTEPGRGFHGEGREAHGNHGSHFPTGRLGRPGSRALLCGPKTLPGPINCSAASDFSSYKAEAPEKPHILEGTGGQGPAVPRGGTGTIH